ncbi:hypothetical protein GCM10008968_29850 [Bacillus horti]
MVDNLEYIHDNLKQKGIYITEIEVDPTLEKYFLFKDLDGNQFGLFQDIKK